MRSFYDLLFLLLFLSIVFLFDGAIPGCNSFMMFLLRILYFVIRFNISVFLLCNDYIFIKFSSFVCSHVSYVVCSTRSEFNSCKCLCHALFFLRQFFLYFWMKKCIRHCTAEYFSIVFRDKKKNTLAQNRNCILLCCIMCVHLTSKWVVFFLMWWNFEYHSMLLSVIDVFI